MKRVVQTILGIGILVIIFLVASHAVTWIYDQKKKANQTHAVSHARAIGFALFEFQLVYGEFPSVSTLKSVRKQSEFLVPLGTKTSNDFFRQLIVAGLVWNEVIFHAEICGSKKPDEVMGKKTLESGECGYSYLVGLPLKGNPSRPICVTPLVPGTDRFDPEPFDGKAVILKMDNSVTSHPIAKNGHVLVDGRNVLDPEHPIWDGKPPTIAWPE